MTQFKFTEQKMIVRVQSSGEGIHAILGPYKHDYIPQDGEHVVDMVTSVTKTQITGGKKVTTIMNNFTGKLEILSTEYLWRYRVREMIGKWLHTCGNKCFNIADRIY